MKMMLIFFILMLPLGCSKIDFNPLSTVVRYAVTGGDR